MATSTAEITRRVFDLYVSERFDELVALLGEAVTLRPGAGRGRLVRGRRAVREHLESLRRARGAPDQLETTHVRGETALLIGRCRAPAKTDSARAALLLRFEGGMIIHIEGPGDVAASLARAGVSESDWASLDKRPGTRELAAHVVDRPEPGRVTLELATGELREAPLPERIRSSFSIGDPALAYLDEADRLVGWYLPDLQVGVDLSGE